MRYLCSEPGLITHRASTGRHRARRRFPAHLWLRFRTRRCLCRQPRRHRSCRPGAAQLGLLSVTRAGRSPGHRGRRWVSRGDNLPARPAAPTPSCWRVPKPSISANFPPGAAPLVASN